MTWGKLHTKFKVHVINKVPLDRGALALLPAASGRSDPQRQSRTAARGCSQSLKHWCVTTCTSVGPCSGTRKLHVNTLRVDPRIQSNPHQRTPAGFLTETDNLLLWFKWKRQGPRVAKTILKRNKVGRTHISLEIVIKMTRNQRLHGGWEGGGRQGDTFPGGQWLKICLVTQGHQFNPWFGKIHTPRSNCTPQGKAVPPTAARRARIRQPRPPQPKINESEKYFKKKTVWGELPLAGQWLDLLFPVEGLGSVPGQGTETPPAMQGRGRK